MERLRGVIRMTTIQDRACERYTCIFLYKLKSKHQCKCRIQMSKDMPST